MFRWLTTSALRMELEEIKHKHKLVMAEMSDGIVRDKKHWEEDKARAIKTLQQDYEAKLSEQALKLKEAVTLAKLDSEQRIKQAQLDADRKMNAEVAKLNSEHYEKLKESMTKLHEEGNANTKFTQDLALKMIGSMPSNKSETKVLTGTLDVGL